VEGSWRKVIGRRREEESGGGGGGPWGIRTELCWEKCGAAGSDGWQTQTGETSGGGGGGCGWTMDGWMDRGRSGLPRLAEFSVNPTRAPVRTTTIAIDRQDSEGLGTRGRRECYRGGGGGDGGWGRRKGDANEVVGGRLLLCRTGGRQEAGGWTIEERARPGKRPRQKRRQAGRIERVLPLDSLILKAVKGTATVRSLMAKRIACM
jgi:hypothetical protein